MPFAIDTYIPAIPQIAEELSTKVEYVAMTISLYIFGVAVGQLIGGYLSDKFGRMNIMISGLILFVLCAFYLTTVDTIAQLWVGRIIQSFGAGVAIVGVPAIIRDNAEGREASQLFTLIGFISILGPAIAPVAGTLILLHFSWHAIFIFLGGYGLLTVVMCKKYIPKEKKWEEDKPKEPILQGYLKVFKERKALGFLISAALFFSSFFTYLSNASVAYMDYFGVSEKSFTFLFTLNIVFVVIVNRANAYLLKRQQPQKIVRIFQKCQFAGTIFLLCATLFAPQTLWLAVVGFIASACFGGGVGPNLNVLFMEHFPDNAGTASGIYGAFQAIVAAIISAGATYFYNGTLIPMTFVIFICSAISFFLVHWQLNYNDRKKEESLTD